MITSDIEIIRKLSLREIFQQTEAFQSSPDPLIRLGALYHLGSKGDDEEQVNEQLEAVLNNENPEKLVTAGSDQFLYFLHVAIRLAQRNKYFGVRWILQCLVAAKNEEARHKALIALKSCNRFPLAVMISIALDLAAPGISINQLDSLMSYSEDSIIDFAQLSIEEQHKKLEELLFSLESIRTMPRQDGFDLSIGILLNRPLGYDIGIPYTGFIYAQPNIGKQLIMPYDTGNVINRESDLLGQSIWNLQRQPGLRALLVYKTGDFPEIDNVYFLPFAHLDEKEMQDRMLRLALIDEPNMVGVVHSIQKNEKGPYYRLITASGKSWIGSRQADRQKQGNCFIDYPGNGRSLSIRCSIPLERFGDIAEAFAQNTDIPLFVQVSYDEKNKRHLLLSNSGKELFREGDFKPGGLYVDKGNPPFALSEKNWPAEIRQRVVEQFFQNRSESLGVTIGMRTGNDGKILMRIILPNGYGIEQPVDYALPAGTPALVRPKRGKDGNEIGGRPSVHILSRFRLVKGCGYCFGTGHRLCSVCEGEGYVTCPSCNGYRKVKCERCAGTKRCHVCKGFGFYLDSRKICKKCGGNGVCQSCLEDPGWWNCRECRGRGTVRCRRCEGNNIRPCECGGLQKSKLIEIG